MLLGVYLYLDTCWTLFFKSHEEGDCAAFFVSVMCDLPVYYGWLIAKPRRSVNTDRLIEVQDKQRVGQSVEEMLLCTSDEAKTHQTVALTGTEGN